jgi:hypothetical protein
VHPTSNAPIALHEAIKGNFHAAWFYTLSHTLSHFVSHQAQCLKWFFLPHLAAQRNKTAFVHKTEKKHTRKDRESERWMDGSSDFLSDDCGRMSAGALYLRCVLCGKRDALECEMRIGFRIKAERKN